MLFHLTTRQEWEAAQKVGELRPPSLAAQGFVHLSTAAQWPLTVKRFFSGQPWVVLLELDEAKLTAPVKFEEADGDQFPHLYGPLNLGAVVKARRRWPFFSPLQLAAAIVLALSSLTLRVGFILDDYKLLAEAHGLLPRFAPLDYFSFAGPPERTHALIVRGPYPWWTLPELKMSFFRPLSSALFWLDTRLFGETAWAYHLHSMLWLLALVAVAWALFRRVLPGTTAAIALLLFALDDSHSVPVAWLANRNALVATALVLLGVVAHLRWREEGWKPGQWLGAAGLAGGLLAGEAALMAASYFFAFELFAGAGPLSRRLRALIPVIGVGLVWALFYRLDSHGAYGSGMYLDPGLNPVAFLQSAGARFLALMGALTMGVSSDFWLALPPVRPVLIGAGVLGLTLMGVVVRSCWQLLEPAEQRTVRWMGAGAILSVAPGLAIFPADRILLAASLGSSAVVAVLLRAAWRRKRLAGWAVTGWLITVNVIAPPLAWGTTTWILRTWSRSVKAVILDSPPGQFEGKVVLLTAADFAPAVYGVAYLMEAGRPRPDRWWVLSMNLHAHRLRRAGERALELEVVGGRMLETVFEQLLRGPQFPIAAGAVVQLEGAQVTVLAVEEGAPVRIRIDFERPLTEYRLLAWRHEAFEQIQPPEGDVVLELPGAPTMMERALQAF